MLSERSEKALDGVHPDLVRIVRRADEICDVDFVVIEGVRSLKRQREMVAKGASKTLKSRHLTGHAVDVVSVIDGEPSFAWPPLYEIATAMFKASEELGIPLEWGGRWKSFKDGPHWQLPWRSYPANAAS